jgi:hypothetical protein
MPNGFDFNFKEAYGKEFEKMSRKEKDQAILTQLYYLRQGTKSIPWLNKLAWVAVAVIPTMMGLIVWLIKIHIPI